MATIDLKGRPRIRQRLFVWYSKLLSDQASNGLSVAEYAQAPGLTPTTLYHWKRRLSGTPLSRVERSGTPARPEGLIRLSLPQRPAPTARAGFVVRVGGGRRVETPDDEDNEARQRLPSVLERC